MTVGRKWESDRANSSDKKSNKGATPNSLERKSISANADF